MLSFMKSIFEDMKRKEIRLEEGDEAAYILDDAIVLLEMAPGRELKVKIIAGEPEWLHIKTNLLEEKPEGA